MSVAVAIEARRYTPEDLLALAGGKGYELVDGRLREKQVGAESSRIGTRLCSRLDRYSEENGLGIVWGADNGYQCFPHAPEMVRKPDVSFVKSGRLPGDIAPRGWVRIAPDLAVEIISPHDSAEELEGKLEDYAKAGVPLVWVIYPERRRARVFRGDGPTTVVGEEDDLTGEAILPGFRCRLREILPPRVADEPV